MTEPTRPDDRELEQYLRGDSPLSRRYRDASREGAPPELDEAILAQARAEARRKPSLNRFLAPVALAASLVIAVNLAWNLHEVEGPPGEDRVLTAEKSRDEQGFAPEPAPLPAPSPEPGPVLQAPEVATAPAAPPAPEARRGAPNEAPQIEERLERDAELAAAQQRERADVQAKAKAEEEERATLARRAQSQQPAVSERQESAVALDSAGAAAPAAALADHAPLSEAAKIDYLIRYIRGLPGAVFIRNGKEYGPAEAAKHLQYKREKAGDRVQTAEDFIRLCASHSYTSGEAYLIRFADGRTRTAEDVLRDELARIGR